MLFATTRPYLRNVTLVPQTYDDQMCSTGFCVLRALPGDAVPKYLFHVCRSEIVVDQLTPKMRGASYPAVTDNDVLDVEIPTPPPDIQHRIVTRLDALLAEVAEARRLHTEIAADTDHLLVAALRTSFEELSSSVPPARLGDRTIAEVFPGQHVMSTDYSSAPPGTPYITGPADFGTKFPVISKWTAKPTVMSKPGDVLFTVKGSGVGKVNVASADEPVCIGRQVMAVRPNQNCLLTDFLFFALLGVSMSFKLYAKAQQFQVSERNMSRALRYPFLPEIYSYRSFPTWRPCRAKYWKCNELKRTKPRCSMKSSRHSCAKPFVASCEAVRCHQLHPPPVPTSSRY